MTTLRYVAISIVGFVLFTGLGAAQGSGPLQGVAITPEAARRWVPTSLTPTFSPAAGAYSSPQSVTISTSTLGCSRYIYWNTTGNPTSGSTHGTSVSVASSKTVYAKVIGCPGYSDSAVGSAAYTITSSQAATPAFSPAAGVYSSTQSVTISTSTPRCSGYIYWNTTGNPTSGSTRGTSVSVASSQTVYAKVIGCPGYSNSAVGSAAYTITSSSQAATPAFSPAAGAYSSPQSVTISTSAPGCSGYIYWNTTGNPTSGSTHGTSVSVASNQTVYARVIGCPGYSNSAVGSAAYTITSSSQAATPAFSPAAGAYSSPQSVTISTSTPGCSGYIYWNTTGNPTSGNTHGTSVSVASSETVYAKVIGCPGYSDSAIGWAAYTITSSSQAATPAFSPAAGAYSSTQSVTISTSTPGCSGYIYWNTTGSPTSSDTQGNSVSVASNQTVYAKVIGCPGYADSAVGSAAYTMTSGPGLPTLVQDSAWGTNDGTENGNGFTYHLPNASLGGSSTQGDSSNNLIVVAFSWGGTATLTSLSDNNGNAWTTGASCNDSGSPRRNIRILYAMGAKAGTQDLTLTFSASVAEVHLRATEFYNVSVSSAVDGTPSCTASTSNFGPFIAAGSITTTVDNDLIYHYGTDNTALCCTNPVTSFAVGTDFSLLPSDRHLGHFAQWQVQSTHGSINPTMTVNQRSNDGFDSGAIALKAASAGTAPGSGIRIVRQFHTNNDASGTDFTVQWPCSGNLTVFSQGESNVYHTITSITDSNSNTFNLVSRSSGEPYMYYAAGMNCGSPNTRTMVVHGNVGGSTATDVIYDIANAAASPYDNRASGLDSQGAAGTSSCVLNSSATDHAPNITPVAAPGIAIVVAEEGTGPRCALYGTGYVADMGWYTGASDNSTLMDNGNGYGHYYYSSTSTIDFHWLWANGTTSSGYNLAATFKQ